MSYRWAGFHGYLWKCSDVYSPIGLGKYLHSGGGRCILYEKDANPKDLRGNNRRRQTSPPPFGLGHESWTEDNGDDSAATTESSPGGGSSEDSQGSLAGEMEGNTTRNKTEKIPRVIVIRRLVERFKPETSLELIQAVQQLGTAFEKDFLVRSNTTNHFSYQLDQAIYEDHLASKYKSWEELVKICPVETLAIRKNYLSVDDSISWFLRILEFNNINPFAFITDLVEIIDRKKPKKNTLWLWGPPNCGKSLIINSIGDSLCYAFRGDQPDAKEARFVYAGLATARVGILNEFKVYPNTADKCLLLLEGADVVNDVKNKQPVNIQRTPLLISTNGLLWDGLASRDLATKVPAITQRVTRYNLATFQDLAECDGNFHPHMWPSMIHKYNLVDCDVEEIAE